MKEFKIVNKLIMKKFKIVNILIMKKFKIVNILIMKKFNIDYILTKKEIVNLSTSHFPGTVHNGTERSEVRRRPQLLPLL